MNTFHKAWLEPSSLKEAVKVQKEMAARVSLQEEALVPEVVVGMDVSNNLFDPSQKVYAAAVALSYPELAVQETASVEEVQTFPYIPGLLGFREAPALIHALQKLKKKPDLIVIDGHGISHPRGLGIASHIGVLLDVPTIGVAKSILVGEPESALKEEAGSTVPLVWQGKILGMFLRTKRRCLPVIVSPGHRMSLQGALSFVRSAVKGYRLPEPTRQAHLAANACRILAHAATKTKHGNS